MQFHVSQKTLRHLRAAEGYLQLGMAGHALQELDDVTEVETCEGPLCFLRGEALKAQQRFEEASLSLQQATMLLPDVHTHYIWLSLGECFRETGRLQLAEVAEQTAAEIELKHTLEMKPVFFVLPAQMTNPANGRMS